MRFLTLLLTLLLSCKSIQTTINQTGTGNTATTATAEKPDAMATGADATAVEADKPKAPVQVGTGNEQQATDNTKAGQKGGAAATAPGAQATATTEKENWLRAVMPYAAGVVALGLLYCLLPLGLSGSGWLLAVLRRRRSQEPKTS